MKAVRFGDKMVTLVNMKSAEVDKYNTKDFTVLIHYHGNEVETIGRGTREEMETLLKMIFDYYTKE